MSTGVMVAVVTLVALASCITASQVGEDRVVVSTEDGKISGFKEYSTKGRGFYTFLGIPYAKPPLQELRLKVSEKRTVRVL